MTRYKQFLAAVEPPFLRDLLAENDGNITLAAEAAGMARNTFRAKIRAYGIVQKPARIDEPQRRTKLATDLSLGRCARVYRRSP